MDYLDSLNKQQKLAILKTDKPVLVLAGAGTGKTRVITNKIVYLIKEKNYNLERILALTFTRKAANEMNERVKHYLNITTDLKWITTFHSLGAKILRHEAPNFGLKTNFTIYDSDDSNKIIKELLEINNMDGDIKPSEMKEIFSKIKLHGASDEIFKDPKIKHHKDLYIDYNIYLRKNNAVDFDDLNYLIYNVLSKNLLSQRVWKNRFDYILVDEFQDVNWIQQQIVNLLMENKNKLTVVGDAQQAIYSWRGSNPSFILNFDKENTETKIYRLEQNYRSNKKIIETANNITSQFTGEWTEKILELYANRKEEGSVSYTRYNNRYEEAIGVIDEIKRLIKHNKYKLSDCAILVRLTYLTRSIEKALYNNNLPYEVIKGLKFFDRLEVKDLLSYLKIVINPQDKISLVRCINTPTRGIGKSALIKIEENYIDDWIDAVNKTSKKVTGKVKKGLDDFYKLIQIITPLVENSSAEALQIIYDTIKYEKYLQDKYPIDFEDRKANILELKSHLESLKDNNITFSQFLEDSLLSSEQDKINHNDTIKIMTIHSAKGLEFSNVWLYGLDHGVLPSYRSFDNKYAFDEEKRLFYVATTRAKDNLFLSNSKKDKSAYWSFDKENIKPSVFLSYIK